jgi:hypothetical protein
MLATTLQADVGGMTVKVKPSRQQLLSVLAVRKIES